MKESKDFSESATHAVGNQLFFYLTYRLSIFDDEVVMYFNAVQNVYLVQNLFACKLFLTLNKKIISLWKQKLVLRKMCWFFL